MEEPYHSLYLLQGGRYVAIEGLPSTAHCTELVCHTAKSTHILCTHQCHHTRPVEFTGQWNPSQHRKSRPLKGHSLRNALPVSKITWEIQIRNFNMARVPKNKSCKLESSETSSYPRVACGNRGTPFVFKRLL